MRVERVHDDYCTVYCRLVGTCARAHQADIRVKQVICDKARVALPQKQKTRAIFGCGPSLRRLSGHSTWFRRFGHDHDDDAGLLRLAAPGEPDIPELSLS